MLTAPERRFEMLPVLEGFKILHEAETLKKQQQQQKSPARQKRGGKKAKRKKQRRRSRRWRKR